MPLRRKARPLGTKPAPKRLSRPEQRVYDAFLDLVRQWKYNFKGQTITELLEDVENNLGPTPLNRFQVILNEVSTEVAVRAGKQAAADFDTWSNKQLRGLTMSFEGHFDSYDPRVLAEIRNHTAMQMVGITNQTRDAIVQAVENSYTQGHTAQELAKIVRPMIGLTHRDATAVTNLYNARIKAGDSPVVARRLADQAAERHLKRRAKTIARTELIDAANRGRQAAWAQAIGDGFIDPSIVQQKWVTGADERLCKICGPMNGQIVDIGADFFSSANSNYYSAPPVHPNCRCAVAMVERKTKGSTAVGKHLPGHHDQKSHGRRFGEANTGGVHKFDNYADTFLEDEERGMAAGDRYATDEEMQRFIEDIEPGAYDIKTYYESGEYGDSIDLAEVKGVKNVTMEDFDTDRRGDLLIEDRHQLRAVETYTGTAYDIINTDLREGRNTKYVKELDAYLEDDGHYGLKLFRGTTADEFGMDIDDLPSLTGSTFSTKSYLSTSLDASVAQHFASSGSGDVIMSVTLGSDVHARGMATGFGINPQGEYEVLVQRNTKFKVNEVNRLWANVDGEPKVLATVIQVESV